MKSIGKSLSQTFNSSSNASLSSDSSSQPTAPAPVSRDEQVPKLMNDGSRRAVVLRGTSNGRTGGAVLRSGWSHDSCENSSDSSASGSVSSASSSESFVSTKSSLSKEEPDPVEPQDLNCDINEIADKILQEPLDDMEKAEVLIALVNQLDGLENDVKRNAFFVKMQHAANNMAQQPKAELLEALAHAIGKLHPDYRWAAFHLVRIAADKLSPPCKSSVLGHLAERISDLIGEEMLNAFRLLTHSARHMQEPQEDFLSKMKAVIQAAADEERNEFIARTQNAAQYRAQQPRVELLGALVIAISKLPSSYRDEAIHAVASAAHNLTPFHKSPVLGHLVKHVCDLMMEGEATKALDPLMNSAKNMPERQQALFLFKVTGVIQHSASEEERSNVVDRIFAEINSWKSPTEKVLVLNELARQIPFLKNEQARSNLLEKTLDAARNLPDRNKSGVLKSLDCMTKHLPAGEERLKAKQKISDARRPLNRQKKEGDDSLRRSALQNSWNEAQEKIYRAVVDESLAQINELDSDWKKAKALSAEVEEILSFPTAQERASVLEKTLAAAMTLPPEHRNSLLKRLANMSKYLPAGERRFEVTQQILNVERLDPLFSLPMEKKVELLRIAAGSIPDMLSLKQYQAFIIILDSVRDERMGFVEDSAHALQVLKALATILPALKTQKFDAFKLLMAAGDRLEAQQKTVLLCSLVKAVRSVKRDAFSQVMNKAGELPADCKTEVLKALSGVLFEIWVQQRNTGRAFLHKVSRLPAGLKIAVYETVLSQIPRHNFSAEKDQLQQYVATLLAGAREELQRALRDSQAQQRPHATRQTAYHA